MTCDAFNNFFDDQSSKPSPYRFEVMQLMIDHDYVGGDRARLPWASVGSAVEGTGLVPAAAMFCDMYHALANHEVHDQINFDDIFIAGCLFGEEYQSAMFLGKVPFDDAGAIVGPGAIDDIDKGMMIAGKIFTKQVREAIDYAQATEGAKLAFRMMAMSGHPAYRELSPWLVLKSVLPRLPNLGRYLSVKKIMTLRSTDEYKLQLCVDMMWASVGKVGEIEVLRETPRRLLNIVNEIDTFFHHESDFFEKLRRSFDSGVETHTEKILLDHPRAMTAVEVAAAARLGVLPDENGAWDDGLIEMLEQLRPGQYSPDQQKWPFELIWVTTDCITLQRGMAYELVALDARGRVVKSARPSPCVVDDGVPYLKWGSAPKTVGDLGDYVDVSTLRTDFLNEAQLRDALGVNVPTQAIRAERGGFATICERHRWGEACNDGKSCPYEYHFGDDGHGVFFKTSEKRKERRGRNPICSVCGSEWDRRHRRCSSASCQWPAYQATMNQHEADGTPYPAFWKTRPSATAARPPAASATARPPPEDDDAPVAKRLRKTRR